jgi:serine/threonine protein kinase
MSVHSKLWIKKLFWKTVERGNERADSIVRETCVQATLITQARDHKGFLRLKSYFETRDKVVLELELLEGTDLYQYIKKKQPLSELEASNIMYDILSCVVVMKNLGIAHRDLKPANILMANKSNRYGMRVNVGDFGNATFVGADNLVRGRCGTVGYVAPEIFLAQKNSGYENKVDEFSAGVILYVLLCGYEPFYGETEKKLIKENTKAKVEFPEEDWQSISVEGRDLVEKLLKRDPAERIDASKALQHAWITRRALRKRQSVSQDDGHDHDRFQPENYACSIS